jgi:hypothetical protein
MMWATVLSRRETQDLITSGKAGRGSINVKEVAELPRLNRPDDVVAVWPVHPDIARPLPSIFIVEDSGAKEFLAWTSTYVRDLLPFTSFCRVVERPIATVYLPAPTEITFKINEGVIVGLVIGEVLTQSAGRAVPTQIATNVFSATLSFAIGRLLAITASTGLLNTLESAWGLARSLTGQSRIDVPVTAVRAVWNVVLGISERNNKGSMFWDSSNLINDAWGNLAESGAFHQSVCDGLAKVFPQFSGMQELLQRPREQRVERIEEALRMLARAPQEQGPTSAFLAGYFTSLLGPGSMEHVGMLAPFARAYPTAFMWYGVCSNVVGKMESVVTGNRLARQIIRDLTLPDRIVDRPRCDIALEEVMVSGNDLSALDVRNGRVEIDLLPCVTTALRWHPEENNEETERQLRRDHEVGTLLQELEESQRRTAMISERLRRAMAEVLESRGKKKRRK